MADSEFPQNAGYDTATEKYDAAHRREMAAAGDAMPDGSYPIADADDLRHAIRAVGRGRLDSHDAIRRHVIVRAHALHMDDAIPDDWGPDGRLESA